MTELFENRKIDDEIANRDSHARLVVSRLKYAERKILQREMGIG